ncbi:MAG TPA: lysophospholipid acyltransferase family protein [Anaerolineales bacterium]|nr:lysophospholipid acyltransferase family protein [Anaerolineales bacterium]
MPYPQPRHVRIFRAVGAPILRLIMRIGCRVTLSGMENIPPYGPYLIAINHLATYDAPLAVLFWPYFPEGITAAANFPAPFIGHLVRWYGAIPVQHHGEYDRIALETALTVVRSGSQLLIAPEGHRTFKPGMKEARPGVAYLALKANVPIVPVGLTGTETLMPSWKRLRRPHLTMTVGKPFCLPEEPLTREDRHEKLTEYTTLIMKKIAELLPVEYRGVYGS